MNWKYVTLHCPTCGFDHDFKRTCWWEVDGVYIGLYATDDMKSRKECQKELIYGEGSFETVCAYLNPKQDEADSVEAL